ncbi:acyl-CoA dehydrogenase family protein [Paenibacillus sp. NPDC058071]|uniref:acyl-CoA dehydrogenase family protein n=1 Tax=Paenibacillus sp. NPDC058071 TaxID=3346326 RepID=UPI0036DD629A
MQFTEEQKRWRRSVQQFASDAVAPAVELMEREERFPSELIRQMSELGWMGIPIPRIYGGMGSDFISYIIAIHELSKVSAAVGVILSVHTSVATLPILQFGSEDQLQRYVTALAQGTKLGAFALTEPQAGSDASSIRTTATRAGVDYVLNGSKLFITNAGAADLYVVFAVTDPTVKEKARGITAFIVERDAPGLSIGPSERKMGLHGSLTCELVFDGLTVPVAQRLGQEGEGFAIAMQTLDGGRIGIAAQALGIAEAALRLIEERCRPSGRGRLTPEAAEQAELTAAFEAARLLVYRAAYMRGEGIPCTKESSMAKLAASDTAVRLAGAAVRLYGTEGCLPGSPAERLFRDAKVTQIYEGTNEIHRIVISGKLLQ